MREPKFYLIIKDGWWMAGKHGYQTKRAATEFADQWRKTMVMSGLNVDLVFAAIRVEKA